MSHMEGSCLRDVSNQRARRWGTRPKRVRHMAERPSLRRVGSANLAWGLLLLPGGLGLGHVLGYRMTEGLGGALSVSTGHGYLGQLGVLAVPLTLAVVARAFVAGTRGEPLPVRFGVLATQQVLLFLAIEVLEHATVGITPASSLGEISLIVGSATQVTIAAAFCWFVRLVSRVGAAVAGSSATRPTHRTSVPRCQPTRRSHPAMTIDLAAVSRRGPPGSLTS